jgi:hypothetical protein
MKNLVNMSKKITVYDSSMPKTPVKENQEQQENA